MTVLGAAMQAFLMFSVVILGWFELVGWLNEREERRREQAKYTRLPELQPTFLRRVL